MGIGKAVQLSLHCLNDGRVIVAQARHGRAPASVQVTLTLTVYNVRTLAADGERQLSAGVTMKDMIYEDVPIFY